ncbi:PQQ-binding-like beta-propeller repeat protein, partial [bacterium]|nr:PQQ-binding-like beta-propeller repeat protein [bacterium]
MSQTLSVLPATKAPNPGAIVMLRADPRSVVNITFQWTSDCTDGAFYSPTVTAGNQTTLGVVWFQLPSTASRTCQVLVTATSPGIIWSGNTTVTTRPVISTNWLSFHSDPANTGRTTEFDLGPTPGTLGQVWKVSGGNVSTVSPALSLQGGVGRVILGDLDGVVRSFAATDGSLSWTTTLGDRLVGNPIIGDGNVMVATAFGAVKALDLATGNELWSVNVGNQVEAVPTYAFGVLVVGSIGGSVHGVATGRTISSSLDRLMWTTQVSGRIIGSLSVFDGVLGGSPSLSNLYDAVAFLGTDQGFFYAIRVADGEILNQWQLGARIVTAPAVFMMGADPAVAVATEDGKLFVFSAQAPFGSLVTSPDGVLYTSNSPVTSAPVFHDGNLYFFLRDNRAISFDPITESLTFSQFLPSASPDSENLVCTNTPGVALSSTDVPYLYLSCYELFVGGDSLFPFVTARGLLVILSENTITGQIEELGRYAVGTFQFEGASYTPGDAVISPPVVMGGMVYLTSQDGSLYALGPVPVFDFTGGPSLWPAKRGDPTGTGFFGTGPGLGILQEKWSFQMPGRVTASPALAGDTLWIGDLDGNLVGLRAGDGLHRFTWGGFNELGATPILMDDNLVFIHGLSGVGDLLAMDGDRLTLVGRVRTIFTDRLEREQGGGGLSDILERMRQITSLSPAYDEQTRTLFVPMV